MLDEHRDALAAVARRAVPERAREDVVQETYLRALGAECLPADPERLRRFLVVVARRVCIDWLRRERHRRAAELTDDGAADPAPGFEELHLREETEFWLRGVDGPARQLLRAFHVDGWPLRELAARSGMTVSALAQRLHRTRRAVRQRAGGRAHHSCTRP